MQLDPRNRKPFHAAGHNAVEQVDLDAEVVGDELSGSAAVGSDSAHSSGGRDHDIWPYLLEERRGRAGVAQIELGRGASDQILEPVGGEVDPERRPDQTSVRRDENRCFWRYRCKASTAHS
jgi:hypothetical protein